MSVDYIYTRSAQRLSTPNDVTILASAPEVTDNGFVIGNESYFPNPSRYLRYAGITMTGSSNRLTLGGNPYVTYNIRYTGKEMHREVVAANFTGNGTIVFSAQSGASRASEVNQDSNLRFRTEATSTSSRTNNRTTYTEPAVSISDATVFKAAGDLSIAGDVAGTLEAVSSSSLDGYCVTESGKTAYKNNSTNQSGIAIGFHSTNFVLGNNFNGNLLSTSTASITAILSSATQTQNNTYEALGIRASGNVTATQGQWKGSIDSSVENVLLRADVDQVVPDDKGEKKVSSATVSNNTINATGIEAGGTVTISEMTGGNNITSLVSGSELFAHSSNSDSSGTVNFQNNVITSYGINAGTLELGTYDQSATISVEASNNTYSVFLGPHKDNFSVSTTGNKISSIAMKANSMTVENFLGSLQVVLNDNLFTLNNNLTIESSSNNVVFQASGIAVSETLSSTSSLYGTIDVTATGNDIINGTNTGKYSVILAHGITAKTISVTGLIESDITLNISNADLSSSDLFNVNSVFGIKADKLTASAFSGEIKFTEYPSKESQFGIYSRNGFYTDVTGDAFDMAGTIKILGGSSYGIYSEDTLNLRVSGSITATYAIVTEGHYDETQATFIYTGNPNRKDQVELASTAVINGNIDLGGDENSIVINSGAKMTGNLLAEDGKLNIEFVLDDTYAGGAIVTTQNLNDISLTSAGTLTVNLNNAVNGQTYTLFQYNGNASSYWSNKSVTLVYQGATKTIALQNGKIADGDRQFNGATLDIWYENGQVFVKADGIKDNKQLGATLDSTVDQEKRSVTLSWNGADSYEQYELEYTVNGKSVVVKLSGTATNYEIKGLAAHEVSDITWKIRGVDGKGATVSQWQTGATISYDPLIDPSTSVVTLPGNAPYIVNPDDEGAGITSAIARFSWGRAESSNGYAIKNYTVEFFGSGVKLDEDKINAIFDGSDTSERVYTKTVTATEATVSSLTNQHFVYWRVKATDVYGNESKYYRGEDFRIWVGDNVAPTFDPQEGNGKQAGVSFEADRSDPYNVQLKLTFGWCNASDTQSDVKQYVVEYKLKDQSWEDATRKVVAQGEQTEPGDYDYNWTTTVKGGLYDYRIYAVDYVGNQTDPNASDDFHGEFGYTDLEPPVGRFISFGEPVVTVSKITNTDELGNTTTTITGATVSCSWSDDYTDASGVRYIVEFSNNRNFLSTGSSNGVQNRTASVTSSTQSVTLGNNVGAASGLLSGMTTVYWRVKAVDTVGNESAIWGNAGSFEFKDPETGIYITDTGTLTAPTSLSQSTNGRNVTFSWYGGTYSFGLKEYELHYVLAGGREQVISGITTNSVTTELTRDGVCQWWVVAINGDGSQSANSESTEFLLDSTAPSWDSYGEEGAGLTVTPARNNPILSWNAAIDDGSGVEYYLLEYRIANSTVWNSQKVEGTREMLQLGNGNYVFRVTAVDAGGNRQISNEIEFTVGDALDFSDTRAEADRQVAADSSLVITAGAGSWRNDSEEHADTSIGVQDTADWYVFRVAKTAEVTITVDSLVATYGDSAGITIRVRDNAEKVVESFTVDNLTPGAKETFQMILSAAGSSTFYLEVVGNNNEFVTEYHFQVDSRLLPVNNADDTKELVDAAGSTYTVTVPRKEPGAGSHVSIDVIAQDWVGYDDGIDYRKLIVNQGGSYTLTVGDLDSAVKLTLWEVDEKSGKLKSLKNISVTPKQNKDGSWSSRSGAISDLLLEAGTYYVSVQNPSASKGINTDYYVKLEGDVFNRPDNDYKNNYVRGYLKHETTDAEVLTTVIPDDRSKFSDLAVISDEWVGFADSVDFQRVVLEESGNYTFQISGLTGKAKLTVWEYNDKGQLKSLKNLSVTPKMDKNGNWTVQSGELKPLLLEARNADGSQKEYFVSVEATNWKKNENTNYEVTVSGEVFNHPGNALQNNFVQGYLKHETTDAAVLTTTISDAQSKISNVAVISDEWVGFGDAVDFQRIVFEESGNYTFQISGLEGKVKLTVWEYNDKGQFKSLKNLSVTPKMDKNGNWSVQSGELKPLLLEGGKEYFVSVEATNWKKGEGSNYDVTVSGEVFNNPGNALQNNFVRGYLKNETTDAAVLTTNIGASQAQISNVAVISDEWVGFGDSIDFQRIVFDAAGSYSFRISGLEGKAKLTVWEYNDKGQLKSLKNISVTPKMDKNGNWSVQSGEISSLLLEAGKEYFVSVEATNWKKGEGSGYDVTVSGEVFNNPGNALLNSTWDAADVRSITPGTTVADEWVGYGDANDFFSLTLGADDAGSYLFRLSTSAGLNGNATLNVYQKQDDGKGGFKLKSVGKFTNTKSDSITLDLESGDYFVEVMSADKGKGKKNTDYDLDVTKLASPDPVAALSSFDGVTAAMQSLAMDSLAGSGLASEALTGSSLEEKKSPLFSVL